jgi:hypothetical protein
MRIFLLILSISFFVACNHAAKVEILVVPPENSQVHTIKLADSLGTVTMSLPSRYDTTFSWTHHSDCGSPCNKIKYRFQPMTLPINKESGWMWFDLTDSIERFTIVHSGYIYPFHKNSDTSFLINIHEKQRADLIKQPDSHKIKSDTIEKIGDYYFSLFVIDLYDSIKSQYYKKVLASTFIKSNGVEFNFELLTKQKDSLKDKFLENSKYFLRTVRINNGM